MTPADEIITNQKRLREISASTTIKEVNAFNLTDRLREANKYAWTNGCGLAAIQIGIPLRFAWFKWGEQEFTLLNPQIIEFSGKNKLQEEGCLSIPNKKVKLKRYYKIKYISDGVKKTAKGFKAQIIQHEIDHMDGVLILDKAV